jgi:hypothetical protein
LAFAFILLHSFSPMKSYKNPCPVSNFKKLHLAPLFQEVKQWGPKKG